METKYKNEKSVLTDFKSKYDPVKTKYRWYLGAITEQRIIDWMVYFYFSCYMVAINLKVLFCTKNWIQE